MFKNLALLLAALVPLAAAGPVTRQITTLDVKGKYIVRLKDDVSTESVDSHITWVNGVHKRNLDGRQLAGVEKQYDFGNFHGYAGKFDDATLEEIKNNPEVAAVEEDQIFKLYDVVSQDGVEWGLSTLSSSEPGGNTYTYDSSAGKGSFAYILDSGVNAEHEDFGGRVELVYNAAGGEHVDDIGHGTHVAGTIGGATYGVAKEAALISVKVFVGVESSTSIILDGFDWAVKDITDKGRESRSVINMSLGGGFSAAFNSAVASAYAAGILSVVASGNEGVVAVGSPASSPDAITVGAIDSSWSEAIFSNYGANVDILAPGEGIKSTWIGSTTATQTLDGTSMACPHVVGLALYLAVAEDIGSAQVLSERIKKLGTTGGVSGGKAGSPDLIAFNGATGGVSKGKKGKKGSPDLISFIGLSA